MLTIRMPHFAIAAFVLCALAAITASPALAGGEIAVFTANQTDPFFDGIRRGGELAAKMKGYKAVQYVPTKPNNIVEQVAQMEDAINRKPSAMIFLPIDPQALIPPVKKANAAGIPMVNVADKAGGGDFISFIGYKDYDLGKLVATYLAAKLDGTGKVIIIDGLKGHHVNEDRLHGFKDGLAAFENITAVPSQPANFSRLQALQVMENMLQAHSDIDGVLTTVDAMAMGALDAIKASGRKGILVASVDGIPEGAEAVRDGRLLATAEFDGFKMACLGVDAIVRHAAGKKLPAQVYLDSLVITQANAADYLARQAKNECPNWDDIVK